MVDLLINDILGEPAILVGLFALIGLMIQHKSISEVIQGTLKTIMGFLVLGAGAGVVVGTLDSFGEMFTYAFGIEGTIPNTQAAAGIVQIAFGTETALIMLFGMIINIVIARFTKWKYIFLTGHHTLAMAAMLAVVLNVGGISGLPLIAIGAVVLGIWMVASPAMIQKYVVQITKNEDIAIGHFGSIGYLISAVSGEIFGNKEKSTEDIKAPKSLDFLRDYIIMVALTMVVMFIVIALVAGQTFVEGHVSGSINFIFFAFMQGLLFAAGIFVLMEGVKMILDHIIPAFQGIADKLIPNAKPALDIPAVFPYAPNAVIVGFLTTFVAGLVMMVLLPIFGLVVVIPGLVSVFFAGGGAGVFGNATGGRRGAVIGSFLAGLLLGFLPALLIPVLGEMGEVGTTFQDQDYGIIGSIIGYLLKALN